MYAPGFIRGDEISLEHIAEAAGVTVREISPRDGSIVDNAGQLFPGTYGAITPTFGVVDPNAEIIARYDGGGDVAVAAKPMGDGLSVYSGVLQMPARNAPRIGSAGGCACLQ